MISFVIYGPTFEATDALFDEIKHLQNVKYIQYPIKSRFFYFFSRVHMNRLKWLPGWKIWRSIYIGQEYAGDCYIYGNPWIYFMYKSGYVQRIKDNNPSSYHVAYLTDINSARKLPLEDMKKVYDRMFIFDKNFAKEYGLDYYPLVYSKKEGFDTGNDIISDVVFIGQSKGRTQKLIKIYERLSSIGMSCDFWIIDDVGAEKSRQGLHFVNKPMDPHESIEHLIKSKVVLELKSIGVDALSDRVIKAVVYNKNIVTDNKKIVDFEFYNTQKMHIFDDIDGITKSILDNYDEKYCYNNDYSPIKFLEKIEGMIPK